MSGWMGHFNIRLNDDRLCTLVMIGADPDGEKELLAVEDGYCPFLQIGPVPSHYHSESQERSGLTESQAGHRFVASPGTPQM